jgi:hypothetical protein
VDARSAAGWGLEASEPFGCGFFWRPVLPLRFCRKRFENRLILKREAVFHLPVSGAVARALTSCMMVTPAMVVALTGCYHL